MEREIRIYVERNFPRAKKLKVKIVEDEIESLSRAVA
jgi:hypothetical protein